MQRHILEFPPRFFPMPCILVRGANGVAHLLIDDIVPRLLACYHPVDGSPIGEPADVSVVYEIVYGVQLAAVVWVLLRLLLRIVLVCGSECNAALAAPLDGLVVLLASADRPQDELVTVVD